MASRTQVCRYFQQQPEESRCLTCDTSKNLGFVFYVAFYVTEGSISLMKLLRLGFPGFGEPCIQMSMGKD
ncbi:unnamed protein product [Victoria cruziana]